MSVLEPIPIEMDEIREIYHREILHTSFSSASIGKLEIENYLDRILLVYCEELYRNKDDDEEEKMFQLQSFDYEILMSIVAMVNQKFREGVDAWESILHKQPSQSTSFFSIIFSKITTLFLEQELTIKEKISILIFFIRCFNSIEIEPIRVVIQQYVSMPIWSCLSPGRLELEFKKVPKLRKFWRKLEKNDQNLSAKQLDRMRFQRRFLHNLIIDFYDCLKRIPTDEKQSRLSSEESYFMRYCERFIEFLTDLEARLPTRRFFNALLDDLHVITVARLSSLYQRSHDGRLFRQLWDRLNFYAKFEIDDVTGEELSDAQISAKHFDRLANLQRKIFKLFQDIEKYRPLFLISIASLNDREKLLQFFSHIDEEEHLILLCQHLDLGLDNLDRIDKICSYFNQLNRREILMEIIVDHFQCQKIQIKKLNKQPLYPCEKIIWDENIVPSKYYSGDHCLALPKLDIQFLTLNDYLLRNFHLFRLESTYEIRQDIESAVAHLKPWKTETDDVMFGGWSRMAIPIESFQITSIGSRKIGEDKPSKVCGEIIVNLNVKKSIKKEWEALRKHDVCFLISVRPECLPGSQYDHNKPFLEQTGLKFVRGCEIEGMLDPQGRLVDETMNERPHFDTDYRTFRVLLDTNQYKVDLDQGQEYFSDIYDSFNILVRRKPKENNFKAVLETIRDLMNTKCVVPNWLRDILLGYGDPSSAHYINNSLNKPMEFLDFFDTFIDYQHLVDSFPGYRIEISPQSCEQLRPPFKLLFDDKNTTIQVKSYKVPNRGPYESEQPKWNRIRFTSTQAEAIRSGIQHGLTMIVGPPGSGKTDLAVQIINNLYHNHPEQRTLIVTHSNQALNAIFEKIMLLDIDERHLLRLGHGEESLETEKDFSRYGRVNFVLLKRLQLLEIVGRLAKSLDLADDVAYTCETAHYFYLYSILSKWEEFICKINAKTSSDPLLIEEHFPFKRFFSDVPPPLFRGESFDEDFDIASGCFRYLKRIFKQLDEFRVFEMMRSGVDRSNYLLIREAKIIAMTCTHAALKRKELVSLRFQYDNILMEEAAQILEIETFIPLLLQNPDLGHNRLKRWIMIGDHLQLPPVIKNISFQKFSNMEQSLFTRFVRLGVPLINLNAQGRCRPSICQLFSWRYKNLENLDHINEMPEYRSPNPGFLYDYQLISVIDFNNIGESEPLPYFYQNLAEAEYVVATFMYMRLLGYPAEKITILTTYNGQKFLIRDVVEQRCATNPFIGRPHKITTVDKFQGQQNDYILLSLVRTKNVGHIRDVRRLVVAMSRARLGLYVFCRDNLFAHCHELKHTFDILKRNPTKLTIIPCEYFFERFSIDRQSIITNQNQTNKNETKIVTIEDMPEMMKFVYEFYQKQIEKMREEDPDRFRSILNGSNLSNTKDEGENVDELADDVAEIDQNRKVDNADVLTNEDDEEVPFEKLTEDDQGINDDIEMKDLIEEKNEPILFKDFEVKS
ncbi:cAMP-dependent protein kinase inhibitor beta-like [Sarcoptes scabiei]|nr:cAMP-dependent protein kinase inhibitor beta-like [Sarcoptes scabiei]